MLKRFYTVITLCPTEIYAPSEMCREVREDDVESWQGNNEEEEEEDEEAVLYVFLGCREGEVESVTLVSVTVEEALDAFF